MLLGSRDKSSKYTAKKVWRQYSTWPNPTSNMKWLGQSHIYKQFEMNNVLTYCFPSFANLKFVPFQIGKCTTRGTCTPVWELLDYTV